VINELYPEKRCIRGEIRAVPRVKEHSDATHSAAQNELATLSTNSAHRVIEGTDHLALIEDEDGAAHTTQAILDVVQASSAELRRQAAGHPDSRRWPWSHTSLG
jgi:hypothetical protein